MGYTHYWYRKKKAFEPATFAKFVEDCQKIAKASEIPLASWNGKGEPEFDPTGVAFNGREDCGHKARDLGIVWPKQPGQNSWLAGAMLERRECDGDCSHESFHIDVDVGEDVYKTDEDEYFAFTKTAFKPYDVVVTGCLIVLDHYFKDQVRVSSDGGDREWEDARRLCQHVLGYGEDFKLPGEEEGNEVA